ncbi:MAG: carbonic anhydrase [Phycisphaerales bacterium]|nr:MAG: carbonic anhydrase [Phycisphaerales bacterium]
MHKFWIPGVIGLASVGGLLLVGLAGCQSGGAARSETLTSETRATMTPQEVLADLKAGNERFVSGNSTRQAWLTQAEATAGGQFPKAIVLSCLDSRVPPEIVFDQGIGDIFVGRVAGNFVNTDLLGSFEFGTAVAGAKVIVVLGHTSCGAVKGAIDRAELGNLTSTLTNIEPAVAAAGGMGERTSRNLALVERVTIENVRHTVNEVTARSAVLAGLVEDGKLIVVGGVYDLTTGEITWLDS